jgi:hypothetical protein
VLRVCGCLVSSLRGWDQKRQAVASPPGSASQPCVAVNGVMGEKPLLVVDGQELHCSPSIRERI